MKSGMRRSELAHEWQKTSLVEHPSPEKAGCAVRAKISPILPKTEFFNSIIPLYQMPSHSISRERKIQPIANGAWQILLRDALNVRFIAKRT
jgi:hypothetical protein